MADYFKGKSEDELRSVFGSNYNNFVRNGGETLFKYGIDNTSYSVHFDNVRGGTGYFESLGYTTTDIYGNQFTDRAKQYSSEYLFTSDEVIGQTGKQNNVKLKLDVADGKVVSARMWVDGKDGLDSAL